jgi:phenylacetic acid degradation operon negative regulatory protein
VPGSIDQLRHRLLGPTAARSILLTVLGEYLLTVDDSVWQETLIRALGTMGYKPPAARQALVRSVAAGWLDSERSGRRARVRLTEETVGMLRAGAQRIYTFGEPRAWDGRWLLVTLRVPEQHRRLRHHVRTRLAWEGFGSLGGGLWISPHVDREANLADLASNGSAAEITSFRVELGQAHDVQHLIREAWDPGAMADAYDAYRSRFHRARPKRPEAIFRAQTGLVHEWRRFPFLDPGLPETLLPGHLPRSRAFALFHERHELWREPAQDYFRSLEASIGPGPCAPGRASSPAEQQRASR